MMARAISPERQRERAAGALTVDDIPARLRPSARQLWLDEVPGHPVTDDEKDAAYLDNGWRPNPFTSKAKQARFDPGPPAPGWRGEVARARHYDAYATWCQERGLTDDRGRILPQWRWSAMQRREAER